jgi:molecular chaperone GrpE
MGSKEDRQGAPPNAIADELQRAMSEAEAAVDAVRGGRPEDVDDDPIEIDSPPSAAVAELEAQVAELRDKWLRAVADLENYRKRVRRDIDDAVMRESAALLQAFLPTVDNLERALSVTADADDRLVQGIQMVLREFLAALARHGITPVASVGRPFDPGLHDALQQVDSPDHAPGTIVQEFERGWVRGERLLRPARVIVAGPGSTGAPSGGEADGG